MSDDGGAAGEVANSGMRITVTFLSAIFGAKSKNDHVNCTLLLDFGGFLTVSMLYSIFDLSQGDP